MPVVLVGGFLGSGKTTLLNHLLRTGGSSSASLRLDSSRSLRLGVLVNDFGAINIDAMLVAGQADGTVSLGNGCLCCVVDSDGLEGALDQLLRPAAGLDAVVIEASGIAEPKALIRMLTSITDRRMHYGGLVYLVDAANIDAVRAQHPAIDDHIAIADMVVLNKADLVAAERLQSIRDHVGELNPTAPLIAAVHAAVDPALLFDPAQRPAQHDVGPRQLGLDELLREADEYDECGHIDHSDSVAHEHLHEQFTSTSFETDEPLDPRRLADFLLRPPAGCYRIKGVVWFDRPKHRQKFVVHAVGGFVDVRREAWAGERPHCSVVAIGAGLDTAEVQARLAAATATEADAADENGILSITRYLR